MAEFFTFLPRTGRAVLYPVYKGTFERHVDWTGPNAFRDRTIQWAKDASRSAEFLESRPDVQGSKLAYYGVSMGGTFGPIFLAVEPRLKTGILLSGGLFTDSKAPAEIDILNFAPRVRVPVLMLNGRLDFAMPSELQQGMFRLFGTAEPDKRLIQFNTGHIPALQDVTRETLNWLDHYLGPVDK